VLELLGRAVFGELRGDRERDVPPVPARAVVAGGQPELQPVPRELARGGGERAADELRLRRGVYGGSWEHVRAVCGGHIQSGGVGLVYRLSGAHVDVRGRCEFIRLLVRDGVHQGIRGVRDDGAPRRCGHGFAGGSECEFG
jgi:hypothetical protein